LRNHIAFQKPYGILQKNPFHKNLSVFDENTNETTFTCVNNLLPDRI